MEREGWPSLTAGAFIGLAVAGIGVAFYWLSVRDLRTAVNELRVQSGALRRRIPKLEM